MRRRIAKEQELGLFLQKPRFQRAEGGGPARLLLDFLLLVLGLFGTAWAFSSAFSIPAHVPALLAAAAVLSALFTAAYRWRFVDILLFLLSAALCVGLWRAQEEIVQGFLLAANGMMAAYTRNSQFQFPTFVMETLTAAEARRCCTIFLTAVLIPAGAALSWAVVRRRSFVFSFLFTFPFLLSALMFTITPDLRAMGLVLLFWAAMAFLSFRRRDSLRRRRFSPKPAASAGMLALLPLLCLLLGGLFLAVPPEDYERPAPVDGLRVELEAAARQVSQRTSGALRFGGSLNQASLQNGGGPSFTGQNVLMVRASEAIPLYLRGFAGALYDGEAWRQLPGERYAGLEEALAGDSPLSLQGLLASQLSSRVFVTVRNVGGDRQIVYSPYFLATSPEEFSAVSYVNDAFLRGKLFSAPEEYSFACANPLWLPVPGSRLLTAEALLNGDSGRMEASYGLDGSEESKRIIEALYREGLPQELLDALPEEQRQLLQKEAVYSNFVYDNYMEVPAELEEKLLEAYGTGGNFTFQDAVEWAADQIRGSGSYTLTPGQTPAGRDFVEYFLFEGREGYCVHFASAAVLLLRSYGIPARYVEGFSVTAEELAGAGAEGWVAVEDRRSHAWAEAYCPGLGWIPVDATPGGGMAAELAQEQEPEEESQPPEKEPESQAESEAPSSQAESEEPQSSSRPDEVPVSQPSGGAAPGQGAGGGLPRWAAAALCAAAFAAFLAGSAVLRRTLRERRFRTLPGNRAVLSMHRYGERLQRFGEPIDPVLQALAEKARFSRQGVNGEERRDALRRVERMRRRAWAALPLWKRVIFLLIAW